MDPFDPFPVIETGRLLLRETTVGDAWEVHFLRSDPAMLRYLKKEPMKDLGEVKIFVQKLQMNRRAGESIEWCITIPPVGRMIGSICLWNFSADRSKGEVGYLLHPGHRKQGIMSEALEAVLAYGFGKLRLSRIEAYTHRDNAPSIAMLRRHGFELTQNIDADNADNLVLVIRAASFLS